MKTRPFFYSLIFTTVLGLSPALASTSSAGAIAADGRASAHITTVHSNALPAHSPVAVMFTTDQGTFGGESLYTVGVDGSNPQPFGIDGVFSAWTRDGSRVVYTSGNNMYTMNADGSNFKELPGSTYTKPAWSPDGTMIAYLDMDGFVSFVKSDGTSGVTVAAGNHTCYGPGMLSVSWKNNTTLVFTDYANHYDSNCPTGIFSVQAVAQLVDPNTGQGTPAVTPVLPDANAWGDAEYAPESGTLAHLEYTANSSNRSLYVGDKSVTPDTRDVQSFDWSPDGKLLVYDDRNSGQIYVIDSAGGNEVNVTSDVTVHAWNNQVPSFQPLKAKISISDVTITADSLGTTMMHVPVTVSPPMGQSVNVSFATAAGSAKPGKEYAEMHDVLTIPAGQATASIDVPILAQPGAAPDKTFTVTLSNPSAGVLDRVTATGTIQAQPTLTTLNAPPSGVGGVKGGYTITISGTHLAGAKEVRFLSQSTQQVVATGQVTGSTATQVHVTAPDATEAAYATDADVPTDAVVVVPGDGQQFTTAVTPADHFTFAIPIISSLSPEKVLSKSSPPTTVTLTGQYLTGADEVSLSVLGENHVDLATVNVHSDTELIFKAPDLTALFKSAVTHHQVDSRGLPYVSVRVLVPLHGSFIKTVGSQIGQDQDRLFQSPVDVTGVSPVFASAKGEFMTIKGHGFNHGLSLTFQYELPNNTLSDPITVQRSAWKGVSDTQFTAPGPNLVEKAFQNKKNNESSGDLKVHVVVSVGISGQQPIQSDDSPQDQFVAGAPRITNLSPARVAAKGHKTIVLKGEGFVGATSVSLVQRDDQGNWVPVSSSASAIPLDKALSSTHVSFQAPNLSSDVPKAGLKVKVMLNVPVFSGQLKVGDLSSLPSNSPDLVYLGK